MKQIQAFVHRHRAADLMHALAAADFHRISVIEGRGLPPPGPLREANYSVQLADSVIDEAQILVICADDDVPRVMAIFQSAMKATRRDSGWLYVLDIERAIALGEALS